MGHHSPQDLSQTGSSQRPSQDQLVRPMCRRRHWKSLENGKRPGKIVVCSIGTLQDTEVVLDSLDDSEEGQTSWDPEVTDLTPI
ncbi:hypothetical protein NDU88_005303 [Pleurodeles waltl]|uniref:Uncharacterized protein n=1 Tax=Pleurodeles waltl TaxID=8319 RepID=A0AAV7UHM8_PLEWA|nr:hypothetical protein NDU88_005303 [Pleurodeles waltl]